MMEWSSQVRSFIEAANLTGVRMIMVGGGAVNWHGYKRHSADVDFWIDSSKKNMKALIEALTLLGFELDQFPKPVLQGEQNISLKFSPVDLDVELITRFSVNRSYNEAYSSSQVVQGPGSENHYWRVLSYDDLVVSKVKAGRPKDLLDIQELKRIRDIL